MYRNQYAGDAMEAVKQGSAAIDLQSKTFPGCIIKANLELSSRQKKIMEIFRNQCHAYLGRFPAKGLLDLEYAMEAVKEGSAAIDLRSKTQVVPACVNKVNLELSSRQKKMLEMFRNQCHTYLGRFPVVGLLEVEYAKETVKQGSAAIGLRSKTHVVLACVNKANSEFYSHQMKIFKIDDRIGVAIADHGRVLSRYLRSECINYNYTYESPLPVGRLVVQLANKAQVCTQRSWKRPYGVGLLVAGFDKSVAHLYYNCPSGNYFEYQAFAIGSHSQAAKTYLERKFNNFTASSREDLIKDALIATRESLQGEKLRSSVCTIAVVGVGEPFHILDQETVQKLIDTLEIVREEEAAPAEPEAAAEQDAAMDQGGARNQDQGGSPMDI